jgi:large subunit ribosomal protein L25
MTDLKLSAEARSDTGKGAGRRMRRAGKIPAVLYGKGQEGIPITLESMDVSHLLATHGATTSVLKLEVKDGGKSLKKNILIKEIQKHPFREEVIHMDLFEVAMDEDISVMVPVEITGEAVGVKEGGILEMKRRELEIVSLPDRIPDSIVIDISALQIGDAVHVENITPPEGVRIPFEANFTILSVVAPAVEPEPEEEEEEAAEGEVVEGKEAAEEEEEESGEE